MDSKKSFQLQDDVIQDSRKKYIEQLMLYITIQDKLCFFTHEFQPPSQNTVFMLFNAPTPSFFVMIVVVLVIVFLIVKSAHMSC